MPGSQQDFIATLQNYWHRQNSPPGLRVLAFLALALVSVDIYARECSPVAPLDSPGWFITLLLLLGLGNSIHVMFKAVSHTLSVMGLVLVLSGFLGVNLSSQLS